MSKQAILERHGAITSPMRAELETRLAVKRGERSETWPPETAAMAVDEGAPADVASGDDPTSAQASLVSLRDAETALDVARHELRLARDTLTSARATVAKRLSEYNRATPTITPEQNVRDWIASNNAARAERAAARYQQSTERLTATARAMGGGGYGNDIRTRRGGGAAYRRGPNGQRAYTKAEAATANALRIREARAKLPSER